MLRRGVAVVAGRGSTSATRHSCRYSTITTTRKALLPAISTTTGSLGAVGRTLQPTQLSQPTSRLLSTTTATATATATPSSNGAATAAAGKGGGGEETSKLANDNKKPKSEKSNVFLDNLGTMFLSGLAVVVLSLVRSYMGSTDRNTVRETLYERAALDPLEIDDLRVANSEFTLDVYRHIYRDLVSAFAGDPQRVTYDEFVKQVRVTMKRLKGDAFTIQLGHLLDRVVLYALKDHNQTSEDPQPLSFWLTVLSLALYAPVPDRILALYEASQLISDRNDTMSSSHQQQQQQDDDGGGDAATANASITNKKEKITVRDARTMVGYLQDTCQLVPDSQVIPLPDAKYPVQKHGRGHVGELFEWDSGNSDGKDGNKRDGDQELLDIDAFADILRSRAVCAWGECYHKRKHV